MMMPSLPPLPGKLHFGRTSWRIAASDALDQALLTQLLGDLYSPLFTALFGFFSDSGPHAAIKESLSSFKSDEPYDP